MDIGVTGVLVVLMSTTLAPSSFLSIMNKLRVYEVCRSLHSVFICVLPSIPPFSGLGLTAAGCCSCVFCFVFDFIETFFLELRA